MPKREGTRSLGLTTVAAVPGLQPGHSDSPGDELFATLPTADADLLQIIRRRRMIVMIMVGICLAAAGGYLLVAKPVYRAEAKLAIDATEPALTANIGAEGRISENHLRTQCELIRSRPVIEEAVAKIGATSLPTLDNGEGVVDNLQTQLSAQAGKRDDIVTVSLSLPDPHQAKRVLAAIVEAYVNYHSEEAHSSAERLVGILRKEREKREAEWTQKQKELLDFQQRNGELSLQGDKGNVIVERLMKLSEAMTAAQQKRIEAQSLYDAAEHTLASPDGTRLLIESALAQSIVGASETEYAELRRQLANLRTSRGVVDRQAMSAHPMARAAQQAAESIQAQLREKQQRFAEAYVTHLRQDLEAAKQTEADLRAAFDEQERAAFALNGKAAERARLLGELQRIEKATDLADSRIKDLGALEQAGAVTVRVVEAAHVGRLPVSPKRAMVLGGGLGAGLLLGVMLALIRDRLDQNLYSTESIRTSLAASTLAVVPHIPGRLETAVCGRLAQASPLSPAAESYRFIRVAIEAELAKGSGRAFLVTSTRNGEGKTTVASNLAVVLAESGRRVLLVDADLRRPAQDRVFGVCADLGLSTVLEGTTRWTEAIQRTDIARVDLLPAGPIPANPSELLSHAALLKLLEEAQKAYDVVLVDSPPVGMVSDAQTLGTACDHMIMVVRAGITNRSSCREAVERLSSMGGDLLGIVVNDATERRHQYGYAGGDVYSLGRKRIVVHRPTALSEVENS